MLIGPEPVVKSEKFRYLGSAMHESGGIDHDAHGRISLPGLNGRWSLMWSAIAE